MRKRSIAIILCFSFLSVIPLGCSFFQGTVATEICSYAEDVTTAVNVLCGVLSDTTATASGIQAAKDNFNAKVQIMNAASNNQINSLQKKGK